MGRIVRSALLALALVLLSVTPGPRDAADAPVDSRPAVSDPSHQLASVVPVVRGATASVVDAGQRSEGDGARPQLVPLAALPVAWLVDADVVSIRADHRLSPHTAAVMPRPCGRAPPVPSSTTSV